MALKRKTAAALAGVLCISLLGVGSAQASLVPHGLINTFAGSGTNALSSPYGIAVDNSGGTSNGDVYVTDTANYRVEKFDADGNFLLMFGKNVNAGTGNPDVCTNAGPPSDVCQNGTQATVGGAPAGALYNPTFIAVDSSAGPSSGDIYVSDADSKIVQKFDSSGNLITSWGGTPAGGQLKVGSVSGLFVDSAGTLFTYIGAVDSSGNNYGVGDPCCALAGKVIRSNNGFSYTVTHFPDPADLPTSLILDPSTQDLYVTNSTTVNRYHFSAIDQVVQPDSSNCTLSFYDGCPPTESFGAGFLKGVQGVAISTSGNAYVADTAHHRVAVFGPATLPDLSNVSVTGGFVPNADVAGHLDLGGSSNVTDCYFEYWITPDNPSKVPCNADSFPSYPYSGPTDVHATLTGLTPAVSYHYQLVATTAQGTDTSALKTFIATGPPLISQEAASNIHTDEATLSYKVNPDGADTTYHLEYGTGDCSVPSSNCTSTADSDIGAGGTDQSFSFHMGDLAPGTTYHYRVVAQNARGTTPGADHTLLTYAPPPGTDPCPNALERKQTEAGLLLDCRAYELVSAPDTGGYDVQSDTEPGRVPLTAYPDAPNRVLYSLHQGSIPGILGSPTNYGLDPYVASRTDSGWQTSYVGLPSNGMAQAGVFGSPLLGADSSLDEFAFGGQGICNPCFADSSTNVPLRLPDGSIVKGMAGTLDPVANPAGTVLEPLSADGSHFIFGSTSKFESAANSNGTDVTIYDRDLKDGTTQVASTLPNGSTIAAGSNVAELGVSANGSSILIGKRLSTDSAANPYYHLYLHQGTDTHSVDLMPTTTSGALFDGMSSDATKVYFTTKDRLLPSQDTDQSADIYEASISANTAALSLISKGSTAGNSDSCSPDSNSDGPAWNNLAGASNCDVVAFAGGAGVAAEDGSIYFLSPETLDGNGTANAPNLFIARPGQSPHFIATLEADHPAIHDALSSHYTHSYADFQITPSGDFAAFASDRSLTGFPNFGHSEIYRYGASADQLACASCAPSGAAATSDTTLTPTGLNLTDDGRVFFTSVESLVLRDTNAKRDAYEWENGAVQLISAGTTPTDSALLSVSSDGTDAFFFTRAVLSPQDQNGATVRIYDARAGGGFLFNPPAPPCQASDECHGPGTVAPVPSDIGTFKGTGGNLASTSSPRHKHTHKHHRRHRHHPRRHGK